MGDRAPPRPAAETPEDRRCGSRNRGTPAILRPAEFHDPQPPSLRAVLRCKLIERKHAVGDALELHVGSLGSAVIQQQDSAVPAHEELLERQDLAAVLERALRQQPQFRQRIEDDPLSGSPARRHPAPPWSSRSARPPKGGTWSAVHRRLSSDSLGDELDDFELVQRPAVRFGNGLELLFRFRKRDIEALLAGLDAFKKVLERKESSCPRRGLRR